MDPEANIKDSDIFVGIDTNLIPTDDDVYEGPPEEVEKYYWADKCWRERREEHELTFSRREGK